jgi:hypothetical protein
MRTGRWICLVALSFVACRGGEKKGPRQDASVPSPTAPPTWEPPPPVATTSLPCFWPARAPHYEGDTRGYSHDSTGPAQCGRVLQAFFHDHPHKHIVAVIPIEYPSVAPSTDAHRREEGTQELLVLHADRGRWPLASTLEVASSSCTQNTFTVAPAHCKASVDSLGVLASGVEFWVPLTRHTREENHSRGTQDILRVGRKPDTNRSETGRPEPGRGPAIRVLTSSSALSRSRHSPSARRAVI